MTQEKHGTGQMKIASNSEWKLWGQMDPLWAVASWDGREKSGQKPWTPEEFYGVGASDWQDFVSRWRRYGLDGDSCLEIGCGAGRLTMHIAADFRKTHAVDVSPGMLDFAREHIKSPAVTFHCSDGSSIPLDDNSVSAVFSSHVFQHFDSLAYARHYFSEIARVLRPGGSMMIHLPVYNWPSDEVVFGTIYRIRKLMDDLKTWTHRAFTTLGVRKPTMRGLRYPISFLYAELPACGFDDIEIMIFSVRSNKGLHPCVMARKRSNT
jgi:SAM-dependent methyltransferase